MKLKLTAATVRKLLAAGLWLSVCVTAGVAQSPTPVASRAGDAEVLQELKALRTALDETRNEVVRSRAEIQELRAIVEKLRGDSTSSMQAVAPPIQSAAPQPGVAAPSREDIDILGARIEEQHQTKVESASKFRLKLSGLVLFNAFTTIGNVDEVDLPSVALNSSDGKSRGSLIASLRQSIVGLTGIGPEVFGAKTSGDIQMDFFGGLPPGYAGVSSGVARLRIGRVRFDWKNTSVIAGVDVPFVSPNSPTTYMSIAEPGLATAGNLWTWAPMVRVEHSFEMRPATFKVEGGLLDSIGFTPYYEAIRTPTPGESSGQPTYALRLSAASRNEDRQIVFGVSGLYGPQRFANGADIARWAGALDFRVPVHSHLELSGEFFDGRALDGLGGIAPATVVSQNTNLYPYVGAPALARLRDLGGWGQVKWRFNSRHEVNLAAGYGGRDSSALRNAAATDTLLASVPARNETLFVNYILSPRSDLVFSVEYRRLRTFGINGPPDTADRVGLAAGFLF